VGHDSYGRGHGGCGRCADGGRDAAHRRPRPDPREGRTDGRNPRGHIEPDVSAGRAVDGCEFFSLLFTLSNVEVSLAAPASASLTFLGNAFAAKIFLKENVDRRRWLAALFVCAGVFLLAK
jgi:hypothetical protein